MHTGPALVPEAPPPVEKDRRRSARAARNTDAWLRSPTAKNPRDREHATIVNQSRHGVSLRVQRPLPTGTYYILQIGEAELTKLTEVRIVSCRKGEEGVFVVGAQFC